MWYYNIVIVPNDNNIHLENEERNEMKILIVGNNDELCDDIVETYSKGENEIFVLNRVKDDSIIDPKTYPMAINNSRIEQVRSGKEKYTLIFPEESLKESKYQHISVAENIFDKALNIAEEMMNSKDIGVYEVSNDEVYLRLVSVSRSINRELIKNSYRVEENVEFGQVIKDKEPYFNEECNGKLPAMMCPITFENKVIAIIAAFNPLNKVSSYNKKLFKLIGSMVTSSIVQVYKYESVSSFRKYLKGTRILYEEYFKEVIRQKNKYKAENHIEYTLLKLKSDLADNIAGPKEIYEVIKGSIRGIDQLGVNMKDELFLLLTNTCKEEASFVIKRLKNVKILAEVICDDTLF